MENMIRKYGFILEEEKNMPEAGGDARLWRHEKTGASLLSICNGDENKCFGVSFYTPPVNSTGVAHILEHSVLCGSKKYPVKEPFVELLKGSLQTFLNAFTFPDKTCYPVASANLRDFYNLMDVYLDAVFHPLLNEDTFCQEGWHIEAESIDQPWIYKGVVYNEMKGAYSSPESVLAEQSQQAVFPDNLYKLDSGGNPECIPDLTYDAFLDFHRRYYQPSNARFFFWGDDPEDERLLRIAAVIDSYGRGPDFPVVSLQPRLPKPRYIELPYAAGKDDTRAFFTVNWLLGERGDIRQALKMEMLEHILEGLPGSPLRRRLMESGLGEDMAGCGLETDLRQMYYSTGLKGISPAAVGQAEQLILNTLRELAEKGIPEDAINAAVNTVEFAYRESNTGRLPRGLVAMIQSLSTWLYDGDPLAPLAWEGPLKEIKQALAKGEKIFEQAIKESFLDNTHRMRVALLPDAALAETREKEEKSRLAALREESSSLKRENLVEETKRLRQAQLAPDDPRQLEKIPSLTVADLPLKNQKIPAELKNAPVTFLINDLPTHGIIYTTLLLPIKHLPPRLAPYLPLFSRSLLEWGTAKEDYAALGARIASQLGGLAAAPLSGMNIANNNVFCYLSINAKAVYDKMGDLFAIINEILLNPQKDRDVILRRLSQMVLEDKARMEYAAQAAGHSVVQTRLRAHYRGESALTEQMAGVEQLYFLRELAKRLEERPESVIEDFEELRALVIGGSDAVFNCIAETKALAEAEKQAADLIKSMPERPIPSEAELIAAWRPMRLPKAEAFITPAQINYVGKAANLYDLGYKYNGAANVILRWLRMGRLWEEVRVAGGAYGVFCLLDRIGGTFTCSSYRDPNVDRTLSVYDGLADYLRGFTPTKQQLSQAIVGAVGDLDAYLLPDAKGAKTLGWLLSGLTEEMRQQARDEMLATTGKDFNSFADVIAAFAREGDICVLGGSETAKAAANHGWKEHNLF